MKRLDSLRASGPLTVANMCAKCGRQILACVNDPECKAALDCLQACSPTDQARAVLSSPPTLEPNCSYVLPFRQFYCTAQRFACTFLSLLQWRATTPVISLVPLTKARWMLSKLRA